jgi:hypothetical protein
MTSRGLIRAEKMITRIRELERAFPAVSFRVVADFPMYAVGDNGSVWSAARGRLTRLAEDDSSPGGYRRVQVWSGGYSEKRSVASLVLEAFVGPRPTSPVRHQSCHRNRNVADNALSNLRWDVPAGNCADKIMHGTYEIGEGHHATILRDVSVREILLRAMGGELGRHLAAEFGVSATVVMEIINRTKRADVAAPEGYDEWRRSWRWSAGERSGKNKVSVDQVRQIRARRTENREALAAEFGVTRFTIKDIWSGRSWKTVA